VSIIVPVRNGARCLGQQLAALERQRYGGRWEVVVVDNGSSDGSAAVAGDWAGRLSLRTVGANRRRGINVARNAGAAVACGDLLAFCDADDQVAPGWLEALVEAAGRADLVGGRLDEEALNQQPHAPRRPRHPLDRLPTALEFLPFAPGANLAIWADVLAALGGFDERFVLGNDDVDLAFRAQLAGYRLGYAPGAVVAYRHRRRDHELFLQFRNYGRTEPLLFRLHRHQGLVRSSAGGVARRWARLLLAAPIAWTSAERRGRWLAIAGFSVGRVEGSLRERTGFL
jgi:glycosyltransferase involved in cell wall biosynthesis